MRNLLAPCLIMTLAACDILSPKSPAHKTCRDIALSRLKHPGSYEIISDTEQKRAAGGVEVKLTFTAWNDYKVPTTHNISCEFQDGDNAIAATLVSVTWNGRPIRQHELDDIREKR